ncbi:MAG: hypothetical protein MUF01_14830 [Bryobacterales bacterium]|jgi:hypothetical protein|nr:hypothetical protein [Bryobacterales bacterium]
MTTANLSLDVIQAAHVCMAFVDAELADLPEGERLHLLEVLTSYIEARRKNPVPRFVLLLDRGSGRTRLSLVRVGKGGAGC